MKKSKKIIIAIAIVLGLGVTTYSFATVPVQQPCSGTSTYDGPIHSCEGASLNCTYAC